MGFEGSQLLGYEGTAAHSPHQRFSRDTIPVPCRVSRRQRMPNTHPASPPPAARGCTKTFTRVKALVKRMIRVAILFRFLSQQNNLPTPVSSASNFDGPHVSIRETRRFFFFSFFPSSPHPESGVRPATCLVGTGIGRGL